MSESANRASQKTAKTRLTGASTGSTKAKSRLPMPSRHVADGGDNGLGWQRRLENFHSELVRQIAPYLHRSRPLNEYDFQVWSWQFARLEPPF
jgi:hypothetical protein